jgi:hypothetical protein
MSFRESSSTLPTIFMGCRDYIQCGGKCEEKIFTPHDAIDAEHRCEVSAGDIFGCYK